MRLGLISGAHGRSFSLYTLLIPRRPTGREFATKPTSAAPEGKVVDRVLEGAWLHRCLASLFFFAPHTDGCRLCSWSARRDLALSFAPSFSSPFKSVLFSCRVQLHLFDLLSHCALWVCLYECTLTHVLTFIPACQKILLTSPSAVNFRGGAAAGDDGMERKPRLVLHLPRESLPIAASSGRIAE